MRLPRTLFRQRGMATILGVVFLITAIVVVLIQTLRINGSRSVDNSVQLSSTRALYLAESGLERGTALVNAAGEPAAETACTAVTGTFSPTGTGGSFTVSGAGSGCVGGICDRCTLTSTGTIGNVQRVIRRNVNFVVVNGVSGNGTVTTPLALENSSSTRSAVALFSLAAKKQSNNTTTSCNSFSGGACTTGWNVRSSSGNGINGAGVAVVLDPSATGDVTHTIAPDAQNYALVGALIPGASSAVAPSISGFYWDDNSSGNCTNRTVCNSSAAAGSVTNGASVSGGTCIAWTQPADPPGDSRQTCSNWCFADSSSNLTNTLVYAFSGEENSSSIVGSLSWVTLNGTTQTDGIAMTRLANFPTTAWVASNGVYSEIWYKQNPTYLVGAVFTGYIAPKVAFTASTTSSNTTLNVTAVASGTLGVGDAINGTGIPSGTKIIALGTGSGGTGTYTLGANATATAAGVSMNSTRMTVSAVSSGTITSGDTLSSNTPTSNCTGAGNCVTASTKIVALGTGTGGTGTYYVGTSQTVGSSASQKTITSGPTSATGTSGGIKTITVTVPSGVLPGVNTIVAVRSGTGRFATTASGTVASQSGSQFTVQVASTQTTADLSGAQICGGTCAFFNHTTTSNTTFTTSQTSTSQWASGFMCAANAGTPTPVTTTQVTPNYWEEVVQ